MLIIATPKSIPEIVDLKAAQVDGLVFSSERFTRDPLLPLAEYDLFKAISACQSHGLRAYVMVDAIIHETDLKPLKQLLAGLSSQDIDGIVAYDLTTALLAADLGLAAKVIFQPGTFNTHPHAFGQLRALGINQATLSREITFAKIREIMETNKDIAFSLVGHGYLDMFYSQRKLLTLFHQYRKREFAKDGAYALAEKQAPDRLYPISEDATGTHIYRSRKLQSFPYLPYLNRHLAELFLSRHHLDDLEYFAAITAYKTGDYTAFLERYGGEYDTGFYEVATDRYPGANP